MILGMWITGGDAIRDLILVFFNNLFSNLDQVIIDKSWDGHHVKLSDRQKFILNMQPSLLKIKKSSFRYEFLKSSWA